MFQLVLFLKRFYALVMALLALVSGATGSLGALEDGSAITATKRQYCFDNDRIIFGGYNAVKSNLQSVQYASEAGLDFLIASVDDAYLDECAEYGIGVIAKGYNAPALYSRSSQENIDKWLSLTADNYRDHPALWGDDLIDEPNAESFDAMADIADSYRENINGKISLINLFPMYANEEQLGNKADISKQNELLFPRYDFSDIGIDSYKRHVSDYISKIDTDYISVDIYPMKIESTTGKNFTDTTWLRNLDILAEACRETERDLWVIVQSAGNTENEDGVMRHCTKTEDISQQVYASLAFGAKAIIYACFQSGWWDTSSHMLDSEGNRTETYYAVQKVNSEVEVFADIFGDYVYTSTFMLNDILVAGQQYGFLANENESEKPIIKSCVDGLLVGTFRNEKNGKRAYIVVNAEEVGNESCAAALLTVPFAEGLTVYQGGEIKDICCSSVPLLLGPGEGVFITEK